LAQQELIAKLLEKLKVGDGKNIHVNALPNSVSRIDVYEFANIEQSLHLNFLKVLLSKNSFSFNLTISPSLYKDKSIDEKNILQLLIKKLNHLYYQNIDEYEEHGTKTFAFGYPLLIKRDPINNKKILKSPLFIWYLDINKDKQKSDTWIISRNEEHPMVFNEVLKSQLQLQESISIESILPDEDVLVSESILTDVCVKLLEKFNTKMSENDKIVKLLPCTNNQAIDNLTQEGAWIRWSGVFGLYRTQKQSIIQDLENLSKKSIEPSSSTSIDGLLLPTLTLDPSQEGILQLLENNDKIVIQGPPGTGKSQTLTAILAHALLNNKTVLVVCEKKTALEVLYNNLSNLGLQQWCVMLEDIYQDRKRVVELARQWIDNESIVLPKFRQHDFERLQSNYQSLREEVNHRLSITHKNIFGDDTLLELIIKVKKLISLETPKVDFEVPVVDYNHYIDLFEKIDVASKRYVDFDFKNTIFSTSVFLDFNSSEEILQQYQYLYKNLEEISTIISKNVTDFGNDFDVISDTNNIKLSIGSIFSSKLKSAKTAQNIASEKYLHLLPLIENKKIVVLDFPKTNLLKRWSDISTKLELIKSNIEMVLNNKQNFEKFCDFQIFIFDGKLEKIMEKLTVSPNSKWLDSFSLYYYTNFIKKYFAENNIDTYSQQKFEELIAIEQNLTPLVLQKINYTCQNNLQQHLATKDITHLKFLYNLRKNKQFSARNSLRYIAHQDLEGFQKFFPILMTNPNVCSSILPLEHGIYDIVLMDEASQLKLEDTFSALYRGKIQIISGDKHQMPPSNFFASALAYETTEDEETQENALQQHLAASKSLLEFAEDNSFQQHYLDFHYRSQHPDLIRFSNVGFYQNRLIPMPPKTEYNPIEYRFIEGVYKNSSNENEALEIVKLLFEDIPKKHTDAPSVGIATFNLIQRDLVWSVLWEKAYETESNMKILETYLQNGLFVKNLENIQGDERDIIILSTTFGKDENGKFIQNFGPLNTQKGYQLLNVIITRAKKNFYVISSIPIPEPALLAQELAQNNNNGKAIVYAYLYFAKACSNQETEQKNWILENLQQSSIFANKKVEATTLTKAIAEFSHEPNITVDIPFGGFTLDIVKEGKVEDALNAVGATLSTQLYRYVIHKKSILEKYNYQYQPFWIFDWWQKE
jgi:superfamily I DNA and/or RNA helicase